eukprot:scaffold11728_cov171-Amphora_coffeaeformis.AAC.6
MATMVFLSVVSSAFLKSLSPSTHNPNVGSHTRGAAVSVGGVEVASVVGEFSLVGVVVVLLNSTWAAQRVAGTACWPYDCQQANGGPCREVVELHVVEHSKDRFTWYRGSSLFYFLCAFFVVVLSHRELHSKRRNARILLTPASQNWFLSVGFVPSWLAKSEKEPTNRSNKRHTEKALLTQQDNMSASMKPIASSFPNPAHPNFHDDAHMAPPDARTALLSSILSLLPNTTSTDPGLKRAPTSNVSKSSLDLASYYY